MVYVTLYKRVSFNKNVYLEKESQTKKLWHIKPNVTEKRTTCKKKSLFERNVYQKDLHKTVTIVTYFYPNLD